MLKGPNLKTILDAIDRCCQDLMGIILPFGNKLILPGNWW